MSYILYKSRLLYLDLQPFLRPQILRRRKHILPQIYRTVTTICIIINISSYSCKIFYYFCPVLNKIGALRSILVYIYIYIHIHTHEGEPKNNWNSNVVCELEVVARCAARSHESRQYSSGLSLGVDLG
jgi:hypothetical protein